MSGKPAILAIKIVSDADKAQAGIRDVDRAFDGLEDSAKAAARAVDAQSDAARAAKRSLADVAESTDTLDSKAASATGALGALSSGFELVGLEKYATGLQSAAMATDFFSGVGEASTLVLETIKDSALASRLANLKQAASSRVAAVATRAQAVAQRVLNVAMRANPIGLIITAIVALVAIVVIAYKRSETFRRIVDRALAGARNAWDALKRTAGVVKDAIVGGFQRIGDMAGRVKSWVVDRLGGAFRRARDIAKGALALYLKPIQFVIDKIQDLVGWISNIRWPSPPGWLSKIGGVLGLSGGGGGGGAGLMSTRTLGATSLSTSALQSSGSGAFASPGGVTIVLQGVYDEDQAARRIEQLLGRRARRVRGS